MDRNEAKEFHPIMQAFAEGKVIECRNKPDSIKQYSVNSYVID
jgi:ADP-glucose pyrophosphorylase